MKSFYFDVHLTVKESWHVQISADKLPTKKQILKAIQDNKIDDVTDSETLEVLSIEKVELLQQDEIDEEETEDE